MQRARRNYMTAAFLGRGEYFEACCAHKRGLRLSCVVDSSLSCPMFKVIPAPPISLPPYTPPSRAPCDPRSDPPAAFEQPLASPTLSQHQGGPLPSTVVVPWDNQETLANGNVQDREAQEGKRFQRAQDKTGSLRDNDKPRPHSMQD